MAQSLSKSQLKEQLPSSLREISVGSESASDHSSGRGVLPLRSQLKSGGGQKHVGRANKKPGSSGAGSD